MQAKIVIALAMVCPTLAASEATLMGQTQNAPPPPAPYSALAQDVADNDGDLPLPDAPGLLDDSLTLPDGTQQSAPLGIPLGATPATESEMAPSTDAHRSEFPYVPSSSPDAGLGGAGLGVAVSDPSGCSACGGASSYNRCGCSSQYFPWFKGPGRCDQWCVGPHWQVAVDGLIWRREEVDLGLFAAAIGVAPDLTDPMQFGPGARVSVTGYNDAGLGMRVVYEGINQFDAASNFPLAAADRSIDYHSSINSIEINFLRHNPETWKLYGGFRYLELDEDIDDKTIVDKAIPLPADPPAASAAFVDLVDSVQLENRLFGFQLGVFRDSWQLSRRLSVEGFCNGGVYLNDMRRDNIALNSTTVINGDDLATPGDNEFSQTTTTTQNVVTRSFADVAMAGEVGVTGVLRLSQCTAARCGYQALLLDGVGEGIDAYFTPGFSSSTVLFHGLQVGLEYRR